MDSILEKVTAFVTRDGGAAAELLVFRHPTAGIQLPAGTVEEGETVEAAVIREVREETGLENVLLKEQLAVPTQELTGDEGMLLDATFLHDQPSLNSASQGPYLKRGVRVQVRQRTADFSQISYSEYELRGESFVLTSTLEGWAPSRLLATEVVRYYFHFTCETTTAETWEVYTDEHWFKLHWLPLRPKPRLVKRQQAWLDLVYPQLLARI